MCPASIRGLLDAWERGAGQAPAQRALTLLEAACPEATPEALAKLSIGQRDAHLLTLRERVFGPQLACLAVCPGCGERLEVNFHVDNIRTQHQAQPAELALRLADYDVKFRLPNSLDLLALTSSEGLPDAQHMLIERCLLSAHHDGNETTARQLPPEVVEAVAARMAQADPQADVQLRLSCTRCSHQWEMVFDIVSFLSSEINAWARRLLREVHTLAYNYGWSEADILGLSPWRRQFYLELVGV
jgi:hypothetical protein